MLSVRNIEKNVKSLLTELKVTNVNYRAYRLYLKRESSVVSGMMTNL